MSLQQGRFSSTVSDSPIDQSARALVERLAKAITSKIHHSNRVTIEKWAWKSRDSKLGKMSLPLSHDCEYHMHIKNPKGSLAQSARSITLAYP